MSDFGLVTFFGGAAMAIVACYSLGLKGLDTSRVDISGEVAALFWGIALVILSIFI